MTNTISTLMKCKTSSIKSVENLFQSIANEITDPDMLMFIDEATHNMKISGRKKGWLLVGKRCIQRRCFVCGQQYSILPVLTLDRIIIYNGIPRSVTSGHFLSFLCELIVCYIYTKVVLH